jgi:hypothetical protein
VCDSGGGGASVHRRTGTAGLNDGRYEAAIREFSCVIAAAPPEVEGYRGRIEAQLLAGRYPTPFAITPC